MALASYGGPLSLQAEHSAPFRAVLLFPPSRSSAVCVSTAPNHAVLARDQLSEFFCLCVSRDMPLSEDAQTIDTLSRTSWKAVISTRTARAHI